MDKAQLELIAKAAEHKAQLIRELEPKPWKRTEKQKEAYDTYTQLAAYARRAIEIE